MELGLTFVFVTVIVFQCLGNMEAAVQNCDGDDYDDTNGICLDISEGGTGYIYCKYGYCYAGRIGAIPTCLPNGHNDCITTCTEVQIYFMSSWDSSPRCLCIGPTKSDCTGPTRVEDCAVCGWMEVCYGDDCYGNIEFCNPNPCKNDGTCAAKGDSVGYTCTCAAGYAGKICDEIVRRKKFGC